MDSAKHHNNWCDEITWKKRITSQQHYEECRKVKHNFNTMDATFNSMPQMISLRIRSVELVASFCFFLFPFPSVGDWVGASCLQVDILYEFSIPENLSSTPWCIWRASITSWSNFPLAYPLLKVYYCHARFSKYAEAESRRESATYVSEKNTYAHTLSLK